MLKHKTKQKLLILECSRAKIIKSTESRDHDVLKHILYISVGKTLI